MAGKNFLEQFSTDNKPDSFKEEVFVPSKQPKKPLNITVIIVLAVVVFLGSGFKYSFSFINLSIGFSLVVAWISSFISLFNFLTISISSLMVLNSLL